MRGQAGTQRAHDPDDERVLQLALELVGERDVLVQVLQVLAHVAGGAGPGQAHRHRGRPGHGQEDGKENHEVHRYTSIFVMRKMMNDPMATMPAVPMSTISPTPWNIGFM